MKFLITACHPFEDGNGRKARVLTNAELVARGQHRIVIPTGLWPFPPVVPIATEGERSCGG